MKKTIDSPYNEGKSTLKREERKAEFRNEKFDYVHFYYQDEKTNLKFTPPEIGDLNLNQIYNQYRERKKIPSTEQIINMREKYELAASKMSAILGFGVNTYGNYEKGEIPTEANGEILRIASEPDNFQDLFLKYKKSLFTVKQLDLLNQKLEKLISNQENKRACFGSAWNLWDEEEIPNEHTGYRAHNFKKFAHMALYFIINARNDMFATRLNKLFFYSDFLHYKNTCFSISGAMYHANHFGTVPIKSQLAFSIMFDKQYIDVMPKFIDDKGEPVTSFIALKEFDKSIFSKDELIAMKKVSDTFKDLSTKEIIQINHKEKAWKDLKEEFRRISYQQYAFDLKAFNDNDY